MGTSRLTSQDSGCTLSRNAAPHLVARGRVCPTKIEGKNCLALVSVFFEEATTYEAPS